MRNAPRYEFEKWKSRRTDYFTSEDKDKVLPIPDFPGESKWTGDLPEWRDAKHIPTGIKLLVYAVTIAVAAYGFMSESAFATILGASTFILFAVWCDFVAKKSLPSSPGDWALLEDPNDPNTFLVRYKLYTSPDLVTSVLVGMDRGVAWFEEGCLRFSGHCSSFSLGGQDLDPSPLIPTELDPLAYDLLSLRHPKQRFYLLVSPILESEAKKSRFLKSRREFRKYPKIASGARQYPPLTPNPNAGQNRDANDQ